MTAGGAGPAAGRPAAGVAAVLAVVLLLAQRGATWISLTVDRFGTGGFAEPGGAWGVALTAAALALLALAGLAVRRPRWRPAMAVAALVVVGTGLAAYWTTARVDADFPAGTLAEDRVEVLTSPAPTGWAVVAALAALGVLAVWTLLRDRRLAAVASAVLVAVVAVVAVTAPDRLTVPEEVTVIR